ncbi:ERV/ALR sulfhydryl oxidase domain-containing protein [Kockovaella imperatae]|uniref:Sulfhydryl oxidase n=1 Tax=Kockovaella imperatae TaxID=4999 RepID=A0A1Y1UIY3_9TREE|nr:ERV/ALR sulfhydryl oxidase domain-containing protein [Kockovaella imperatae]ORX37942.1 ERV/ALR sulfhydryl oxidase domain-containing protein [Kockovaella imperatae]
MPGLSRTPRLFLILLVIIIVPTLYLLHPSTSPTPLSSWTKTTTPTTTGGDAIHHVEIESGGIDSDHWRDPIRPQTGNGLANEEDTRGADDEEDELVLMGTHSSDRPKQQEEDLYDMTAFTSPSAPILGTHGGVIMPKMENATAKAELGRSAWKVLHLMTLRYPDTPTQDDRDALKSYFHLFARLYPCGECAEEFQALLKEYPPQTSSRKAASMWLCHVHNMINERLGKPEFDCLTLDEKYDCGCGEDPGASGVPGGQDAATDV